MDSRTPEDARSPDATAPEALEFIRFCRHRRRVGWPELYDEMCAVAGRGLFKGWGTEELNAHGIGFSLFDMPRLAVLVQQVIGEERSSLSPRSPANRAVVRDPLPANAGVVVGLTEDEPTDPAPGLPERLSALAPVSA